MSYAEPCPSGCAEGCEVCGKATPWVIGLSLASPESLAAVLEHRDEIVRGIAQAFGVPVRLLGPEGPKPWPMRDADALAGAWMAGTVNAFLTDCGFDGGSEVASFEITFAPRRRDRAST